MKILLRSYPWVFPFSLLCIIGLIAFFFLGLISPILPPFLTAAIAAYICYPIMRRLKNHHIPATVAAFLVLLFLILIILVLSLIVIPVFLQQLSALNASVPTFINSLQSHIESILNYFSIDFVFDSAHLKAWLANNSQTAQGLATHFMHHVGSKSIAIVTLLTNIILFPLILFYFLRDGDKFVASLASVLPPRYKAKISPVIKDIDSVLSEFLRGELFVMLIMSLFYSISLWLIGLQSGLSIGIIAGLLVCIPYLGSSIGMVLSTLSALVQYNAIMQIWPVWMIFLIGQVIEGNFITPKLVGDRIGLHPVTTIFALLAFGQIFSFIGLLLALPLAAILQVSFKHIGRYYLTSNWYRKSF